MLRKVSSFLREGTSFLWITDGRHRGFLSRGMCLGWRFYAVLFIVVCVSVIYGLYERYSFLERLKRGTSFEATVTNQYVANVKNKNRHSISYNVVLRDKMGNVLVSRVKGLMKDIRGRKVMVYGKVYKGCTLIRLIKRCNIYNSSIKLIRETSLSTYLQGKINDQHMVDGEIQAPANLYKALLLGITLDKKLRESVTALGISHLIAISGMHLAIISTVCFVCIAPLYRIFHPFFPYRNAILDIGLVTIICLFCYATLISQQPSFMRALIMFVIGFVAHMNGIKVINIENLFICAAIIVAWQVNLIFNIGFLLSVSGVMYIFLYLKHFGMSKGIKGLIGISTITFLQMSVIVHYFFPYFSPLQAVSIPLSIMFVAIFPILIIIHMCGIGHILDQWIIPIIEHDFHMSSLYTPAYVVVPYVLLSILSVRSKRLYYVCVLLSVAFYIANLVVFLV